MKRVLSVVLVMLIVFSCVAVSADSNVSLDFLKTKYDYVQAEGSMTMKLNKPLDVLDYLPISEDEFGPLVLKTFVEGLIDSKIDYTEKMAYDNGGRALKAQVDYIVNAPLLINEDLSADARMKMTTWLDFDTTSLAEPKLSIIAKTPFMQEYICMDYNDLIDDDMYDMILAVMPTSPTYDIFMDQAVNLISSNSTVTKRSNIVKITMSNDNLVSMITNILKLTMADNPDIAEINDILSKVQIFDDNAITMEYELDYNNRIKRAKTDINFKTNVYDILTVSGEDADYLERENSYIDLTLTAEEKYSYNKESIDIPAITDDNSINPYEPNDYDYEYDYDYSYIDIYSDTKDEYLQYVLTEKYPLRKVIEGYYSSKNPVTVDDITVSDGKITVANEDNSFSLIITEFSNKVIYNGQEIYLDNPIMEENGTCYVTNEFIEKVFGLTEGYDQWNFNSYGNSYGEISFY